MIFIRRRALLVALILAGLLPVSIGWAQKAARKRETYWNPAEGAPAIIRRARSEYERMNYARALALYQEALEVLPEQYLQGFGAANIYFDIGTCYTKLERYKEAIAAIEKSNSYYPDPDYLASHCAWLGMVYSRMEDYAAAERYWEKATERDPRQAIYFAGLANNSVRLGHYEKAQAAIDDGLQVAATAEVPEHFKEAQLIVHLAKGKYEEAHRLVGSANMLGAHFLDTPSGAIQVNFVFPGGPAHLAGVATGDFVESMNGKPVKNVAGFFSMLAAVPFASTIDIGVMRNQAPDIKRVIAGVPTNLPELAATAKAKSPAASKP